MVNKFKTFIELNVHSIKLKARREELYDVLLEHKEPDFVLI